MLYSALKGYVLHLYKSNNDDYVMCTTCASARSAIKLPETISIFTVHLELVKNIRQKTYLL